MRNIEGEKLFTFSNLQLDNRTSLIVLGIVVPIHPSCSHSLNTYKINSDNNKNTFHVSTGPMMYFIILYLTYNILMYNVFVYIMVGGFSSTIWNRLYPQIGPPLCQLFHRHLVHFIISRHYNIIWSNMTWLHGLWHYDHRTSIMPASKFRPNYIFL